MTSACFSDLIISFIEFPPFIEEAKKHKDEMSKGYSSIIPLFDIIGYNISEDEYKWAWNIVQTRSCSYSISSSTSTSTSTTTTTSSSKKNNVALVPWGDLLNHHVSVNTSAFLDKKTRSYKMVTHTSFLKGDEVNIAYGKHPNSVLFHYYGFVIPDNPEDSIPIEITEDEWALLRKDLHTSSSSDFFWEKKVEIMAQYGLYLSGKYTAYKSDPPCSWNLLTTLRLIFATEKEIKSGAFLFVFEDRVISSSNEILVWTFLKKKAKMISSCFSCSLEEDQKKIMEQTKYSEEQILVIQLRIEVKKILNYLIDYATSTISSSSLNPQTKF
eukprot:TRINITY_DN1860_c1_g1_i3.p1 TRINITY_DN1860_c1_g1~~TRINITY_DN1860_c1_g1_i3.p1  ORF type:complete len:327 (+),score=83.27 TRINITY_DN1860_c1_g1_i3:431-1411(+)